MAASGINEHHEACRKQNFINRQSYLKKLVMADSDGQDDIRAQQIEEDIQRKVDNSPGHLGPLSNYDLEKLHRQHASASGTDEDRRRAIRKEQYLTYTAKINGRLSSINYQQQW